MNDIDTAKEPESQQSAATTAGTPQGQQPQSGGSQKSARSSTPLALYSGLGALALAVILIGINWLCSLSTAQFDMTETKMHTLAPGTIEVLKQLKSSDAPVDVKIFLSPDDDLPTPNLLVQYRELKAKLEQFKEYAGRNLTIETLRPEPDTDAEDAAQQAGVTAQPTEMGQIYFGLAATCLDKTATIPFLARGESTLLEYKLIRSIYRVMPLPKKVVGLMTPLNMEGSGMSMFGGTPPWQFYQQLSEDYDVVKLDVKANEIKMDEHTQYTFNYADGKFTRQEFKNGVEGTKGEGTFTIANNTSSPQEGLPNGGKAPDKVEGASYDLLEGGRMTRLQFTTASTGTHLSGKREGFAYDYKKEDETKGGVKVSKSVDVLVVVHPAGISEEAQWAIDQYLLKGGKALIMLDANNLAAQDSGRQQNPFMRQPSGGVDPSSNLDKLLPLWGYTYDSSNIVADISYQAPRFQNPAIITPDVKAVNTTDPTCRDLKEFLFAFPGSLKGRASSGLTEEVLVQTSKNTQLVNSAQLNDQALRNLVNTFTSTGDTHLLAVKISGKFPGAFPGGKPDAPPPTPPSGGGFNFGQEGAQGAQGEPAPASSPTSEAPATPAPAAPAEAPASGTPAAPPPAPENKEPITATTPPITIDPAPPPPAAPTAENPVPGTTPAATSPPIAVPSPSPGTAGTTAPSTPASPPAEPAKPKVPSLSTAEKEATVYLIADADIIDDRTSMAGARAGSEPINANIPFVLNIIDSLAGNENLIQSRSRVSAARPFTKLNTILEETNKKLREEQKSLQSQIETWKSELTSKGTEIGPGGAQVIVINQQQLQELQDKIDDGEARMRKLRKEYRANIAGKFFKYQAFGILGVPILIILAGVTVWMIRRTKTAAR